MIGESVVASCFVGFLEEASLTEDVQPPGDRILAAIEDAELFDVIEPDGRRRKGGPISRLGLSRSVINRIESVSRERLETESPALSHPCVRK